MAVESESQSTPLQRFLNGAPGAIALVVLVLICYGITLKYGYVMWDDDAYVTNNPHLRSFDGLSRIWTSVGALPQYYPMTFTSFWLEVQVAGLNPAVSHAVNFCLHAFSVLMLWLVLRKLSVPGAWLAAAIFAVHPINVESVAWISERKNTLSLAFGMGALWVYLRYAGLVAVDRPAIETAPVAPKRTAVTESTEGVEGETADDEEAGVQLSLPDDPRRLYLLFIALFVCGLLSKTTLSVLPVAILLILWWKRGRLAWRDVQPLIFPLILGFCAGMLTSYVEHDPYTVGVNGPDWQIGQTWVADKLGRFALAGQTTWFYVISLLLPHPFSLGMAGADLPAWLKPYLPWPLMFSYPKWAVVLGNPLQWVGTIGAVLVVALLWIKRRAWGRGPLVCALLFAAGLFPAMGFFRIYPQRFSWVADHFAYLGAIGFIVGIVALFGRLLTRNRAGRNETLAAVLGALVLAWLIGVTLVHVSTFRDPTTLWTRTLTKNPTSWLALINLGSSDIAQANSTYDYYLRKGDRTKAAAERERLWTEGAALVQRGVDLHPTAYEGYSVLATLAAVRGENDKALALAEQAEAIANSTNTKGDLKPRMIMAEVHKRRGEYDQAEAILRKLIDEDEPRLVSKAPLDFARARMELASLLMRNVHIKPGEQPTPEQIQKVQDVLDQYITATIIAPNAIEPKLQLARIFVENKRYNDALQQLNDVLAVSTNNIDAMMGIAYIAQLNKQYTMANNQLLKVLEVAPRYLPAYVRLAQVLDETGRRDQAIARLEQALALEPGYAPAKQLLAKLKNPSATQPTTAPASQPATAR